jgi:hypothetical protein
MSTRTGGFIGEWPDGPNASEKLILQKHAEYCRSAKRYKRTYYLTRILAVLPSVFLPVAAWTSPIITVVLSILVSFAVGVDSIFNPKDRWVLYSQATDRLVLAKLKALGQYEQWEEVLKTIKETESALVSRLPDIRDLT